MIRVMKIGALCRELAEHELGEDGWVYLREGAPVVAEAECLVATGAQDAPDDELPAAAREAGFTANALDLQSLWSAVGWALDLEENADTDLLVESYRYYLEHDAFLPERGFVPSPVDRDAEPRAFLASLGKEDPSSPCREPGCGRGSVKQSLFCAAHHFQMLRGRPPPPK